MYILHMYVCIGQSMYSDHNEIEHEKVNLPDDPYVISSLP